MPLSVVAVRAKLLGGDGVAGAADDESAAVGGGLGRDAANRHDGEGQEAEENAGRGVIACRITRSSDAGE